MKPGTTYIAADGSRWNVCGDGEPAIPGFNTLHWTWYPDPMRRKHGMIWELRTYDFVTHHNVYHIPCSYLVLFHTIFHEKDQRYHSSAYPLDTLADARIMYDRIKEAPLTEMTLTVL